MFDIIFTKANDIPNRMRYRLKADELLVNLSKYISSHICSPDLLVRFGGDEFALILMSNNRQFVLDKFAQIMNGVKNDLGITISAGLASSTQADNFDVLVNLADKALYKSKQCRRN